MPEYYMIFAGEKIFYQSLLHISYTSPMHFCVRNKQNEV